MLRVRPERYCKASNQPRFQRVEGTHAKCLTEGTTLKPAALTMVLKVKSCYWRIDRA